MTRALALLIPIALACAGARAEECVSMHVPEIDLLGIYVDNDLCQPECIAVVFVYQESNGIRGLQRDDVVHDDTCDGRIEADTLVAHAYESLGG